MESDTIIKEFKNRKAERDYFIESRYEAGIVLKGTEIKSIRSGKLNFKDAYAIIKNGEVWLLNLHIAAYEKDGYSISKGGAFGIHEPERKRKLLLHKREINRLEKKVQEKGYSLIPLRIYIIKRGFAKIEIALARGKKMYDKREKLREKEDARQIEINWKRRRA